MKGSSIRTSAVFFLFAFVVSLLVGGWLNTDLALGNDETSGESLAGIQAIALMIIPPNPDAERSGLKGNEIGTGVKTKLHKSGIKILTDKEMEKLGFPYLSVNVNVGKDKDPKQYSYDVKVEMYKQTIMNPDDAEENIGFALYDTIKIWSSEQKGTASNDDLKNKVQKQIDDSLDKFIAAYFAVNPKTEDKP